MSPPPDEAPPPAPPAGPPGPPDGGDRDAMLQRINQIFCGMVPQNRALDLRVVDYGPGTLTIVLPYALHLVGNPETGVLHGGAVSTLMDATLGGSVFLKLMKPIPVATLDLRIDYLRPAEPGRDVTAYAHCFHLTRNVAFVRGVAYHDDRDRPIASAAGTFMLQTPGQTVMATVTPRTSGDAP